MFRNYLLTAFRNLVKNKAHSVINIAGLSVGMAVALLIGLWIWDELSFDKYNRNYDQVALVMQQQSINGETGTWGSMPLPTGDLLRNSYGSNFRRVVMTSWNFTMILTAGDKQLMKVGEYMEPDGPDLLDLKMIRGRRDALKDPSSILIARSTARAYFGDADPVGRIMKINNKADVKVAGVYEDIPYNSSFGDLSFLAPWELYLQTEKWIREMPNPWGTSAFRVYVQVNDQKDMTAVSSRIRDIKRNNVHKDEARFKPTVFLQPMKKWHLYSEFKNGVNTGGRIQYVWLFGIIGLFVLLLACINFMNLSTARSEQRAKEVGIRKAIGSLRGQLISQFFSESLLVTVLAFVLSLGLVQLSLPFFNGVADKKMTIPWSYPLFWGICLCFSLVTGLIAGSYPALYLSSFQPIKVLKGSFRAGRLASVPRKILVVLQFTVSVILIIGTVIVFRQVQFARNRPIGYNRDGLVQIELATPEIHRHFEAVRDELKKEGAIAEMAESSGPVTGVWSTNGGFKWKGKDPSLAVDFPNTGVSYDYGKTVGWQFVEGRDFSRDFPTDSVGFVLNEAAVKYIGFQHPVGETIIWDDHPFKVIGVIKDMIMESPYEPVPPSLYCIAKDHNSVAILKINPHAGSREALDKIEKVFSEYSPAQPFSYKFVDDEYGKKFGNEERIGRLASFFAGLAIFISCLGLFGMASFMAEQRTKEIGVRKVLGASVFNVWRLLSKDFVILIGISLLISIPVSWYYMDNWLQNYHYHTGVDWWILAAAGFGALAIALLTVSYQAIKAALMNPVKSLRSE